MNTKEQIEQQFATAVNNYLQCFNRLERNIGYSVSGMKRSAGEVNVAIESTFQGKLYQFKDLISQRTLEPYFEEWFATVESCRTLRNNIVHGNWEVIPYLDKPIRFVTQPPGKPESQRKEGCFTLQEFLKQLTGIEKVSEAFSKLREAHGI